jgi:recombination protein RecT
VRNNRGSGRPTVPMDQPNDKDKPGPVVELKSKLWEKRAQIGALFPQHGDLVVRRIIAIAASGYEKLLANQKPDAKAIQPWSVAECVIQAATMGLEAGTSQAYLVPYGDKCQLIIGAEGLIAISYRSGLITSIECECVRANDDFDYQLGDEAFIRHKKAVRKTGFALPPSARSPADAVEAVRGALTHAWALICIKAGGDNRIRKVLTYDDILFYQSFSKARSEDNPWVTNTEGMWRKTVLKRGLQTAPRDPMLQLALSEDETGAWVLPAKEPVTVTVPAEVRGTPALEASHTVSVAEQLRQQQGEPEPAQQQPAEELKAKGIKPTT